MVTVRLCCWTSRWLIKQWNRTDIPGPPQQPGDPQVKTEQRSGVNWPMLSAERPAEANQPLHISSTWIPLTSHALVKASVFTLASSMRQSLSLTLSPPVSLRQTEYLIPPSVRAEAATLTTLPTSLVKSKRTVKLSVRPVTERTCFYRPAG